MNKNKRRDLSVKEKLGILEKYDNLPKMSQRCAAQHLKISQPLLCKILKNRNNIQEILQENKPFDRKRNRSGKDADVDKALTLWFKKVRERDVRIDGQLLKQKAEDLARNMGKSDFIATDGWLNRWKKREGIVYRQLHGEQKDADSPAADQWIKTEWPKIVAQYAPEQIYNADEAGLYFRALPNHTFLFKNEKTTKGNKICKERISVLCCVNMIGEKCPLLVIGKSKNPRCFKNVSRLPVEYYANQNAWMTAAIFGEWLKKWDSKLTNKIVLLIDNCAAHKVDTRLKNINIIFLPANTTSLIQPCDQGIIRALKGFYRSEMRKRVLTLIEKEENLSANMLAKKTSLLDALHLVFSSWERITSLTVQNCFKHAGFVRNDLAVDENEEANIIPEDLNVEDFNDWLSIDDTITARAPMTDKDVCDAVLAKNDLGEENDSDDSDEIVAIPSNKEMSQAMEVLRRGIQAYADNFDIFYKFERFMSNIMQNNLKQSLVTEHFSNK